ncbi:glycoside hydrolase superfamily [Flagelloscypha sp. PMI_526]|nr:glycoside hydrolase superfamily [Flagelloscypha sp. PMI_526]
MANFDPEKLLEQLTSEEKIALLSGYDFWHTVPIPRLNIPSVRVSDGPNGVRGTAWIGGAAASCFPCATGLGASFDVPLLLKVGEALGEECRARGAHCLLGPTTNIQRHPCGGRGFESYSEDPFLSGTMARAWVQGVQSRKVMTTPKHYLANEQEYLRRSNNSVIDERTMHEIYLEPFRHQMKADPHGFMVSYNRVNGIHAAENPLLIRKILRGDWGFKGLVMSDWSGTYSSCEAIKASLDLEMPGPCVMRGSAVERDVIGGKLVPADIEECTLRVLRFVQEAIESGIPFNAKEESIDTPEVRSLLREAAIGGVVLLKNEKTMLPLKPKSGTKIAVIGPNARKAAFSGGGSASLRPTYTVSPLEGITTAANELGAEVKYELGTDISKWTPLLTDYLCLPGGKLSDDLKMKCEFFSENPFEGTPVQPLYTKINNSGYSYFLDGIPHEVPVRGWVKSTATFIPDEDGVWQLGLGVAGQADLYMDGKKVIDNTVNQKQSVLFFTTGAEEVIAEVDVKAGQKYDLEVRFSNFKQLNAQSPYSGRRGGFRLGGQRKRNSKEDIANAVNLSKSSDIVVLVVGTNSEWESEAYDRADIKLPRETDALVEAVLKANSNTIVVNQSGMPVEMPWLSDAPTLVQAFFGGNETGNAIADVLFGKANPSSRLPLTFPVKLEDFPSHEGFGHPTDTVYREGVKVGYRYFDREGGPKSAFPFGHGLSYTSFKLGNLKLSSVANYGVKVELDVSNVGALEGAEVVQVYVHDFYSLVERPEIELKGFTKVVLKPGETKTVSVDLDHSAFSFYDVNSKAWIGEKGDFEIRVGTSSTRIAVAAPYHLNETFSWVGLHEPTKAVLY